MIDDKPWYAARRPDDVVPVPWLHPFVIDYLDGLLCPDWSVLEHGSGGSTLWFAERVHRVVSVEHTEEWRDKIRSLAPVNVTLLTDLPSPAKRFDLFLIDGERGKRGECLLKAHDYVLPGGWIVLDNANRPEYVDAREHLFEFAVLVERFECTVPRSKFLITEFWQCHVSE